MRGQIREATVTLRHVQTVRKGGKIYRYLRIPGQPRIRLPDLPPDHPKFLAAYAEAMASVKIQTRSQAGTIRAMAEGYMRSPHFKALSPVYRHAMTRHIGAIMEQAEDARAAHLKPEHVQADLGPLMPSIARQRLKAWRAICRYGLEMGMIKADPSQTVIRKREPKTDGFAAWTADEVAAFRAAYPIGRPVRAIFELLQWTGARIGDAVRIGPGNVGRDGVLSFTQSKTGTPAFVPWSCALPAYAAGMEADRQAALEAIAALAGHMTFLQANGRGRSKDAAGHDIAKAARKIGIEKSAHGLRKYRATTLANAGATATQIAAWTGHASLSEVSHYTRSADRRAAVIGTEQDQNFGNQTDPNCKPALKSI